MQLVASGIEPVFDKTYTRIPTEFIIFGSRDSADLDVMFLLDELPSVQECKSLASTLTQIYKSDKVIDVNLCVVKNGNVVDAYKGTIDEVNNMLHYTASLHYQECNTPTINLVDRDVPLKIARVLRGILSFISRTEYRPQVKKALKGNAELKISTLESIDLCTITDLGDKHKDMNDFYKLFAFQVGQVMGLFKKDEYYSKSTIASANPILKPHLYKELDEFPEMDAIKTEFLTYVRNNYNLDNIKE